MFYNEYYFKFNENLILMNFDENWSENGEYNQYFIKFSMNSIIIYEST